MELALKKRSSVYLKRTRSALTPGTIKAVKDDFPSGKVKSGLAFPLKSLVNNAIHNIQGYFAHPLMLLALFVVASFVMIWRLHAMESKGFEGTVLGTLIMPYCSGFANLIFAYVMSSSAANGGLVIENCLVNNATNLTLILGLCCDLWFGSRHEQG